MTRHHVHNVEGRTPTRIQYICRRTSWNFQFWVELFGWCSSFALYRLLRRP